MLISYRSHLVLQMGVMLWRKRWQELLPKLQELLVEGDYMSVRLLSGMEPPDLAEMLDAIPPRTRVLLFRLLPKTWL